MKTDIFTFGDQPVRAAMIDEEPWFVAADAAKILGITQVASTLRSFPEDEKGVHSMHTPGGAQNMTVLNEPGMYRLIFMRQMAAKRQWERRNPKRKRLHEGRPVLFAAGTLAGDCEEMVHQLLSLTRAAAAEI